MLAIVVAAAGLQLIVAGVTAADKIKAACRQLGVDGASLTLPAALRACNEAMGIEQSGPLIAQAETLAEQLGLQFKASFSPPERLEQDVAGSTRDGDRAANVMDSLSVQAVMSAPAMVHRFSKEVRREHGVVYLLLLRSTVDA